jgi:tol-pal system protein YbgF
MGIRLLLCAVALAVFPAVAAGQNRQELQVNADLRMLQEQVAKIQLGLNQLGDRLKTADGRIDGVAAANLKSFADQRLVINEIVTTLSTMRERLDENTTRVSQLTQEFTAIRDGLRMLTDQLNSLVAILQPTVNPTDPNAPPGSNSPIGAVTLPESATAYLEQARADYQTGKYELGIEGFKDVIAKFPDSPQAAEAQFWMAESYYQLKKYNDAVREYAKLIATYKQSAFVPDAYFMQGLSYEELKQRENARKMFQQVIKLYPQSTAAISAEQRLKRN